MHKLIGAMSVTELEPTGTKYSYMLSCWLQALWYTYIVKKYLDEKIYLAPEIYIITITITHFAGLLYRFPVEWGEKRGS